MSKPPHLDVALGKKHTIHTAHNKMFSLFRCSLFKPQCNKFEFGVSNILVKKNELVSSYTFNGIVSYVSGEEKM